jgi:hypothetical protein
VQPAETAIARERPCKLHVTAGYRGARGSATIEELWAEVFFVKSVPRLYKENQLPLQVMVVGGDEEGSL